MTNLAIFGTAAGIMYFRVVKPILLKRAGEAGGIYFGRDLLNETNKHPGRDISETQPKTDGIANKEIQIKHLVGADIV